MEINHSKYTGESDDTDTEVDELEGFGNEDGGEAGNVAGELSHGGDVVGDLAM